MWRQEKNTVVKLGGPEAFGNFKLHTQCNFPFGLKNKKPSSFSPKVFTLLVYIPGIFLSSR